MLPDQLSDPFGEQFSELACKSMHVLGSRIKFASDCGELLRLVDAAYRDLPRHRFSHKTPDLQIHLLLLPLRKAIRSGNRRRRSNHLQPPPLVMLQGASFLGGATESSNFVILSPHERAALVVVSPEMLRFAYHTRYELIEFAVFTLAARAQRLVPLHAACVGFGDRGILLMGPTGAGKSTVALHCLLGGLDFLSEDSVFVAPKTMRATGVANYLHVRADSLSWLGQNRAAALIRRSPVIQRRSGVTKFELDLRQDPFRLAKSPLKIKSIVFLSAQHAGPRPLLTPLANSELVAKMASEQAYGAGQPQWQTFVKNAARLQAFELRRGRHPVEGVEALKGLL
jgi:hypothetical protein